MDANTNGSHHAFPHLTLELELGIVRVEGGLSKRELFAAMAMQGILSGNPAATSENLRKNADILAADCAFLADALLAELAKEPCK